MSEPSQPPEAELLERLRTERRPKLSVRAAADMAGMSDARWRQIAKGFKYEAGGIRVPAHAPATTLARMAKVVGATPDQLREVGRDDAADELSTLITVSESGANTRQAGSKNLGRGLAGLIPTERSPEELEQALNVENEVLERTWSAASELTAAVLESGPSDRLRTAAQEVVYLLSADVIIRILSSGLAPHLEAWLERVYREREEWHRALGDTPTPWFQDGVSPKDTAREAARIFLLPRAVVGSADDAPPGIDLAKQDQVVSESADPDAPPDEDLADAARSGSSDGRRLRDAQDRETEAPDPPGSEN